MNFAIPSRSGHTLPELLTVLGIAAILATAAVPLFSVLLLDSRMNAVVATAMHAVNLGRQFSATRGETLRLCGSADARECSGAPDWSAGLLLADDAGVFRQAIGFAGGAGVAAKSGGGVGGLRPFSSTPPSRARTRAAMEYFTRFGPG